MIILLAMRKGSRFGFPKAAKQVRTNSDACHYYYVGVRVVDKKKREGPGRKHHIRLDQFSCACDNGQAANNFEGIISIRQVLKQSRKKADSDR